MGSKDQFNFSSAEDAWNEVRRVWPGGSGVSYERIENEGLQWPCPAEDHPGTTVLHAEEFSLGKTTALRRIKF